MKTVTPPTMHYLPLAFLHFDLDNPRFPDSAKITNDSEAIDWMLRDASIIELMGSIGAQGYFPGEPLLVTKTSESLYIVIEGNRRLTAIKLLNDPSLASMKNSIGSFLQSSFSLLEAQVHGRQNYQHLSTLMVSQILKYLGYRHITGILGPGPGCHRSISQATSMLLYHQHCECRKIQRSCQDDSVAVLIIVLKAVNRIDQFTKTIEEDNFFSLPGVRCDGSIMFSVLSYSTKLLRHSIMAWS